AVSSYMSGAGTAIYWNDMPHSEVQLKVDRTGATVYCGAMDIGQGSDSVLAQVAAEELGLQPGDIRLVTADTDPTPVEAGSYKPPRIGGPFKGSGVGPSPAYSYSAAVVEVEADARTGLVEVKKVWIAHDIGRAINPLLVVGQVEGSVYMGLGEALMEEQEFRKGLHKWPSMLEYKSPTFLDTPEIETFIVETIDPEGPYGAKEAGQGPLLPVIPAV